MMAGPVISLPADVLHSSGLEIIGSGPGTIPLAEITGVIPGFWLSQPPVLDGVEDIGVARWMDRLTRCPGA